MPIWLNTYFCIKTNRLETTTIIIIIAIIVIAGALAIMLRKKNTEVDPVRGTDNYSRQLQLQAYERLALLVDRIALPNLIQRTNQPGLSAKDMQLLLTRIIREEFDYNISQQIYVSADAWKAVKNLKEQNQLAINQLANALPPNATAMDLNKIIIDFLMHDKKGSLHEIVGEVLSFEAKRIM
ncbi:MAG: hypothetical protein JWN76_614 [Chitinophagaceae bacterium]|nr:hypothetical protein [Chitinophagaceae bacterium]